MLIGRELFEKAGVRLAGAIADRASPGNPKGAKTKH